MYVCICNAVTESDIRRAAEGGVRNMRQLQKETGCSAGCGSCENLAREVLRDVTSEARPFLSVLAAAPAA